MDSAARSRDVFIPEDGWRDENGHEWRLWCGRMVECPRCAFLFSEAHRDDGKPGYSCPNCEYDGHEPEAWSVDFDAMREARLGDAH